jgi:small GTP-binding protein
VPANLPPDYFEEEKKLRQAKTLDEKIEIIERMLAVIPHHKGTDKLIGSLRARISKLREERERRPQAQKRSDALYNIRKEGAGQALFVGFPNTGKSSLVSALSGEGLETGDYPFTTRHLQQRMMRYEDILIQLVDTPALGDEGVPLWFGNMVRKADIVVIVLALSDALDVEYDLVTEELAPHADHLRHRFVVVNKLDLTEYAAQLGRFEIQVKGRETVIPVSAKDDVNMHQVKELIFRKLEIIRVYSKMPGKKPDLDKPFVLARGATLVECAEMVHRDFAEKLRYARLWRRDRLDGMMVKRDFPLEDRDIVELHM